MSQQFSRNDLDDMIARCITEGMNIIDWERNYLDSIQEQLDRVGKLSENQQEVLDRIYTEKVP